MRNAPKNFRFTKPYRKPPSCLIWCLKIIENNGLGDSFLEAEQNNPTSSSWFAAIHDNNHSGEYSERWTWEFANKDYI